MSDQSVNQPKSIFEYADFRAYLKDFYQFAKAEKKTFSYRFFARLAGCKSSATLKRVMDGSRNLSEKGIEGFCKALRLNREEADFFKQLVQLNQAKTSLEKAVFTREILRSRTYRKFHPLKESQFHYYTKWYFIVIREMANLPQFQEDPEWIARHVLPAITPKQAEDAIKELLKLGLLTRDSQGRLTQANTVLITPDEVTAAVVADYHRESMRKAAESIDLVQRENRDISAVTFRVSKETAKRIKEKIQKFRRDIADEASKESSPEEIYQLNLQLFPLTQVTKDGKD